MKNLIKYKIIPEIQYFIHNILYGFVWRKYKGFYLKREYDIILKDKTMLINCYPNAGKFTPLLDNIGGKTNIGRTPIHGSFVKYFRLSKKTSFEILEELDL